MAVGRDPAIDANAMAYAGALAHGSGYDRPDELIGWVDAMDEPMEREVTL
jgi:hypothetical protein